MAFWKPEERRFAEAVSAFSFFNPFLQDESLGRLQTALQLGAQLSMPVEEGGERRITIDWPEFARVGEIATSLLCQVGMRKQPDGVAEDDFWLYQDLVLFAMYYQFRDRFQQTVGSATSGSHRVSVIDYYDDFERRWQRYWDRGVIGRPSSYTCHHMFAGLFLIRRAHHHIDEFIWGNSLAIQSLRAQVWQSIFTHDFRRFGLLLYDRMEDITTLVSGPSGSGKELVAIAIGMSRYISFDPQTKTFAEEIGGAFHPVNISALSPTLVESELFGHAKGAFTGAEKARDGWFRLCKPGHSVFLDEIGELSPSIQVKLLRVLQSREFQRIGETELHRFGGKLIVASNRGFREEIEQGRFREDLYYRICSDVIVTPSLREQLRSDPEQLRAFAERFAAKHLGNGETAALVADDTYSFVERELGLEYEWPGNFRELEQCVWNVLVRKSYRPLHKGISGSEDQTLEMIRRGQATADEVLAHYCRSVYEKTGSYAAVARVVQLDQRTVKRHISTLQQ